MPEPLGPVRPAPAGGGCWILLKVVPGASRTDVAGIHGDRYRVRVSAPPEGGKANAALLAFLVERLGVARRAVTLVKGASSPLKTVAVAGLSPADAAARLAGA